MTMRHPHYKDFTADDVDRAILAEFGDFALRDLDGQGYAALYADVRDMMTTEDEFVRAFCEEGEEAAAELAARELRIRIGGSDNLRSYVACLLVENACLLARKAQP